MNLFKYFVITATLFILAPALHAMAPDDDPMHVDWTAERGFIAQVPQPNTPRPNILRQRNRRLAGRDRTHGIFTELTGHINDPAILVALQTGFEEGQMFRYLREDARERAANLVIEAALARTLPNNQTEL